MKLLRPVTASLLLSAFLLALTARWAVAAPLRHERMRVTQQEHVNDLYQREQRNNLQRAQELDHTQQQLDQLRDQAARRPGLSAPPRAQQLNETQQQLDQLTLEQQLHGVQQELQRQQLEREPSPLRRQEQLRALQLQQQLPFLQEQSRTKLMQQQLDH